MLLKANGVKILSTGSFLPEKIVKNDELEKSLETSDEWIVKRTGITQRHISSKAEDSAHMAHFAALDAISKFKKINPKFSAENEIGLIIVATTTPNKIFPSVAAQVCAKLGFKKDVIVFDLNAVCSGFLYAFVVANNLMSCAFGKSGKSNKALVIGSEQMSSIVDWNDRSTCILFGDGAGALLLGFENDKKDLNESGMIDSILRSDCSLGQILYADNKFEYLKMNGKEVFLTACKELEKTIKDLCQQNEISISEIDLFLIHQSNARILNLLSENLSIPPEKIPISIALHANTSAASIPLLMDLKQSILKPGSLVVMAAVGGGMVWGACLMRI